MPPTPTDILIQINGVITTLNASEKDTDGDLTQKIALATHAVTCLAPPDSIFRKQEYEINRSQHLLSYKLDLLTGILRGLRTAYELGLFSTVEELIHADLFGDFLNMAEYLLGENYKDAAAVLAGGVLEEHIRKLCKKHRMAVTVPSAKGDEPKRASLMNDDLAKAGAYPKLDQKNVTSWLDLRNKAAHGKYTEYDSKHVEYLITGLKHFVARYPA